METVLPTRPRQPESEPRSEPSERSVTLCVESELSKRRMNGDEEQPSTIIEGDTSPVAAAAATPSERRNGESDPPDPPTTSPSQTLLHPQISAKHFLGRTPM